MGGTQLTTPGSRGLSGLCRPSSRRQVAGVCAGLSRTTGIDVQLIRIAVVVLALGGGVGVALYGCGWALLPSDDSPTFPLARVSERAAGWSMQRRAQVTAVVGFLTWLLLSSWLPLAPVPVLVGLLLLLVHRQQRRAATTRATLDATAAQIPSDGVPAPTSPAGRQFAAAAAAWQARLAELDPGRPHPGTVDQTIIDPASVGFAAPRIDLSTMPTPEPTHPAGDAEGGAAPRGAHATGPLPAAGPSATRPGPVARNRRGGRRNRRERLAWGIAVALLAWLTGVLVGHLPTHLSALACSEVQVSAALAVVGVGMVIAGIRGVRPRLLTPLGVVLGVVLALDHTGLASAHHQWWSVESGSGSAADPLRFVGTRAVRALPSTGDVAVQCRASDLTLTTPNDAQVEISYRLRAADLTVSGEHLGGSMSGTTRTSGTSGRLVHVDLDAAACHVEVRHA